MHTKYIENNLENSFKSATFVGSNGVCYVKLN